MHWPEEKRGRIHQYDTWGDFKKYEYHGENETKIEIVLTCWSVAQAGSNDEKKWGFKISLDCLFKDAVSRDFLPLFFFMNRTHLGP